MRDDDKRRKIWGVPLHPALIVLGCLLIIIGTKFYFIHQYGSDLPFWDQWDAEGDAMFAPAARGNLEAQDFLQPHNEHRIVFTRLLAFGLERLNGQWDGRLEMTVNVFIHVLAIGLLLLVLRPLIEAKAWFAACFLATLLCCLPLAWENTLAGFQSQFYFLLFFALAHLAGTFAAKEKSGAWYAGQIAGVCAIFSLASGFISAVVVLLLIAVDAVRQRRAPSATRIGLAIFNGLLVFAGLLLKHHVAGHDPLKAHGLYDLVLSGLILIAWPCPYWPVAFLALVPAVLLFIAWFRGTAAASHKMFVLAVALWGLTQIGALAVARGANGAVLSSRYFDLLTIFVIITAVIWHDHTKVAESAPAKQNLIRVGCAVWWFALALGLISQYRAMTDTFIRPMREFNRQRVDMVRNYVETKSESLFTAQPFVSLPYPSAERLASLLNDPGIRAVLPPSVRPNLPMGSDAPANGGFSEHDTSKPGGTPIGYPYWSNQPAHEEARFESQPVEKSPHSLVRLLVKSPSNSKDIHLALADGTRRTELSIPSKAKNDWQGVTVWFPHRSFRVVADCAPGATVAFSDPIEVALGGWVCQQLLTLWPLIICIGVGSIIVGLGGLFLQNNEAPI